MKRLLALALLLVAGLSAGAFVACGGGNGDDDARTDYLREVRRLVNNLDERSGEAPNIQTANEALVQLSLISRDTAAQLFQLEPPDDVKDIHNALGTAINDVGVEIGELARQNPDVEDLEAVQELLVDNVAVAEANGRATEACRDMEKYAEDHGEELDLELC